MDKASRRRNAFLGNSTVPVAPPARPRTDQRPFQQPAPMSEPARRTSDSLPEARTQENQRQQRMGEIQRSNPPRRQRLTADRGFAPRQGFAEVSDDELEGMLQATERAEPGSMVRGGLDTGSMQVGGPGYKEPKPF